MARCTIGRLKHREGLRSSTRADESAPRRDDLVERDFSAPAPNRLWVADLTSVRTSSEFVYVAFVFDVFSRYSERLEELEFATLEWVDWFNRTRLLEPIGYVPPSERRR